MRRGHEVTGIARDAGKLAPAEHLTLRNADALSPGVADLLRGHDVVVVVSAMGKASDELIALAKKMSTEPPRRELDMLVSTGERVATLGIV